MFLFHADKSRPEGSGYVQLNESYFILKDAQISQFLTDIPIWNSETLYGNLPKSGLSEVRMATLMAISMVAYVMQEMAFKFFEKILG